MRFNGVSLSSLVQARRLLIYTQRYRDRVKNPNHEKPSALQDFHEDQALNQGQTKTDGVDGKKSTQKAGMNLDIKLSDLIRHFKEGSSGEKVQQGKGQAVEVKAEFSATYQVKTEFSLSYSEMEKVDGLVLRNKQLAETDRYRFEFSSSDRLTIVDKWSGRNTTIWGDPHIDLNDMEGDWNGDFKDLKGSNTHTTFMLMDGTRLTITALDDGIIEAVDIMKDDQHIRGFGGAASEWQEGQEYFQKPSSAYNPSSVPMGDIVKAGGDGNDWYAPGGQLIWGQTTGPSVLSRPYARVEMSYKQEVTQVVEASATITRRV